MGKIRGLVTAFFILVGAAVIGLAWFVFHLNGHPVRQITSSAAPWLTIQFTLAGRSRYGADELFAICTSRGDLLYLAEGTLATSPSLAVVPDGCATPGGGVSPSEK